MLFEEGNPGGVKVALEKQGIMKPLMRMPLYPISQDLRTRIENETERIIG
jgi:4-hydroxy-tetrahydrodipicolinate synthase